MLIRHVLVFLLVVGLPLQAGASISCAGGDDVVAGVADQQHQHHHHHDVEHTGHDLAAGHGSHGDGCELCGPACAVACAMAGIVVGMPVETDRGSDVHSVPMAGDTLPPFPELLLRPPSTIPG